MQAISCGTNDVRMPLVWLARGGWASFVTCICGLPRLCYVCILTDVCGCAVLFWVQCKMWGCILQVGLLHFQQTLSDPAVGMLHYLGCSGGS
jgi:hypothetical protein